MKTPLHAYHEANAGRMVDFHGWRLPLYFSGIVEEHRAVREFAGIFDVSHMGKVCLAGGGIGRRLRRLIPSRLPTQKNSARYTHLLDERGMIIDDVVVACVDTDNYLVVCNAAVHTRVLEWLRAQVGGGQVRDVTARLVCLAVQGPRSREPFARALSTDLTSLSRFQGTLSELPGRAVEANDTAVETEGWEPLSSVLGLGRRGGLREFYVMGTGYTGEEGFEIFAPNDLGKLIWLALLSSDIGGGARIQPAGLGARDTLRLEKGYLLSGQDFDGRQTPLEAGYEWLVDWNNDFVGREALLLQKRLGGYSRLVGLRLLDRGVPRRGNEVYSEGERVGSLTSGNMSPILGFGIGLGYLKSRAARRGFEVEVEIHGKRHPAVIVKTPFV